VTVTPPTGLADLQVVQVSVTTSSPTASGVFLAVTQCGNATTAGAPLVATTANDCVGAAGIGTSLMLIGTGGALAPTGPVAAGTYNVNLTVKKTGIATNGTQCLSVPPATIPCAVAVSTATTAAPTPVRDTP